MLLFYRSFVDVLEKINVKFSLSILHKRVNIYEKKITQRFNDEAIDLKPPLINCINEIISSEEPTPHHTIDYSLISNVPTNTHPNQQYQQLDAHAVKKENIGELSSYFKKRTNGAELHPDIKEKLEQSIWEHLHAAIRYARQHEKANAKMHANIACCACNELAHYLQKEQYKAFVNDIEKHLTTLNLQE